MNRPDDDPEELFAVYDRRDGSYVGYQWAANKRAAVRQHCREPGSDMDQFFAVPDSDS